MRRTLKAEKSHASRTGHSRRSCLCRLSDRAHLHRLRAVGDHAALARLAAAVQGHGPVVIVGLHQVPVLRTQCAEVWHLVVMGPPKSQGRALPGLNAREHEVAARRELARPERVEGVLVGGLVLHDLPRLQHEDLAARLRCQDAGSYPGRVCLYGQLETSVLLPAVAAHTVARVDADGARVHWRLQDGLIVLVERDQGDASTGLPMRSTQVEISSMNNRAVGHRGHDAGAHQVLRDAHLVLHLAKDHIPHGEGRVVHDLAEAP
mmetsp:Transcript_100650/g.285206  ORF Transcript_100650/g.285206 Transcript_100650/m.285206 type:complete len:263 (+) Transcript_100650:249-1037(+)